jgi:hypothetical protein
MAKPIFKVVVSLIMVIALTPSTSKKESIAVLTKAAACEPQSCKSGCIEKGYATGLCGMRGTCECLGHPVD